MCCTFSAVISVMRLADSQQEHITDGRNILL